MSTASRNIRDLLGAANMPLPPVPATPEVKAKLAADTRPLTLVSIDHRDTEQGYTYWDYVLQDADGAQYMLGLPALEIRDTFSETLVQLMQDGPVEGLKLDKLGRGPNPTYFLTVA
jgi:hypothetical protein